MTRILLAPGSANWTYDFTARALERELRDRFDIRIAYAPQDVHAEARHADLIVDFWWRGALEQHYGSRVVKQVSSHRWRQHKYGNLPATVVAAKYLRPAAGVVVPSQRLHAIIGDALDAIGCSVPVTLTPKGFDPMLFSYAKRTGPLRVGWAGTGRQKDKRLDVIREACPDLVEVGPHTRGVELAYEDMPTFYRACDVITCASDAEGDPRPLIEGMACGCFAVTVDVGIVPELVMGSLAGTEIADGVMLYQRGIVVERTAESFARAFAWCAENLDHVRAAGARNSEHLLATRTWTQCARAWGDAFDLALDRRHEEVASAGLL